MRRRQTIRRILGIQRILVKYGLDQVIKETHLLRPLRFMFYLLPRRRNTSAPLGERIRLALEELGPIFVKFGQAISTRRDLLPPDIADELAKLQDEVPPFPGEQAVEILKNQQPLSEQFGTGLIYRWARRSFHAFWDFLMSPFAGSPVGATAQVPRR